MTTNTVILFMYKLPQIVAENSSRKYLKYLRKSLKGKSIYVDVGVLGRVSKRVFKLRIVNNTLVCDISYTPEEYNALINSNYK